MSRSPLLAISEAKPILRWAGGKTELLPEILNLVPKAFGSYHEPFLGGGAVCFALARTGVLRARDVYLSDANEELINLYQQIRLYPEGLIQEIERLLTQHRGQPKETYYGVRETSPASALLRAARFLYLNRTCFNGLHRVNRAGKFNVPFGQIANPHFSAEQLREIAIALRNFGLEACDFRKALLSARAGAFVYLDPPYVPLKSESFTAYAGAFTMVDQEDLAQVIDLLVARGAQVLLSQSDTPWVRDRFARYTIHTVRARRNINAKGSGRGQVNELLIEARP